MTKAVESTWEPVIVPLQVTQPWLKVLFYGDSGVGKTVLAASAEDVPEMKPLLMVNAEAGMLSIRSRAATLPVLAMSDYRTLQNFLTHLRKNGFDKYKTIVIDSITEISKQVIKQCIDEAKAKDANHDREIAEQRDWQRYTERMRTIIRILRDAPQNVILTALEREQRDDVSGAVTYGPAVGGQQVGTDLVAFQDIVGRVQAGNVKDQKFSSTLFFRPSNKFVAKDRSGLLPVSMDTPNMQQIYSHLAKLQATAGGQ